MLNITSEIIKVEVLESDLMAFRHPLQSLTMLPIHTWLQAGIKQIATCNKWQFTTEPK